MTDVAAYIHLGAGPRHPLRTLALPPTGAATRLMPSRQDRV
jgi:hypothetical protein